MTARKTGTALLLGALVLARSAGAQQRATQPAGRAAMAATRVATLPNVVGLSVDSATKILGSTKLPIVRSDSSTNAQPRNQVVAQRPGPGTPLSTVKTVTLVLAVPMRVVPSKNLVVTHAVNGVLVPPSAVVPTTPPPPPAGVPARTNVPDLYGRSVKMVRALLEDAHLRMGRVISDSSDAMAAGFVFQQHPPAKTSVDTGTLVSVWYSLGPHRATATVPTPDVLGRTLVEAAAMLRGARLGVGHVDTLFRPGANGRVEHQLPEPRVPAHPGDAVALQIAIARALVPVPSVIGLRTAEAQSKLKGVGLDLGVVTPVSRPGTDTTIVSQKPVAQTPVEPGTPVDVEENRPAVRRRTAVPPLAGLTADSARRRLVGDSLRLGQVVLADGGRSPVVVAQSPPAGDSVFFYQLVNVTLASPPVVPPTPAPVPAPPPTSVPPPAEQIPLVSVPAVVNLPFETARDLLDSLGLKTVSTTADAGGTLAVVTQSPEAGTLVRLGAPVTLTLASVGPPHVPILVGLKERVAEDHARADGFAMSVQSRHRVLWPLFGRVATQEPPTQTITRADGSIRVDVSVPLVPPVPAAIVLVVAAAVTARTMRPKPRAITDLDFELVVPPSPPPKLATVPGDNLIRAAITFALDAGNGQTSVRPHDQSLIKRIVKQNV